MYWIRIKKGETLVLPAKLNGFVTKQPFAIMHMSGLGVWANENNGKYAFVFYLQYQN